MGNQPGVLFASFVFFVFFNADVVVLCCFPFFVFVLSFFFAKGVCLYVYVCAFALVTFLLKGLLAFFISL